MEGIHGITQTTVKSAQPPEAGAPNDYLILSLGGLDTGGEYSHKVLFNALAAQSRQLALPSYGLQQSLHPGALFKGALRCLATSAPTVGHALVAIMRYIYSCSPSVHYRLENRPGQTVLLLYSLMPADRNNPITVEHAMLAVMLLIAEVRGSGFRPKAITFRHSPLCETAGYQNYFKCPVLFEQEQDSLIFLPGVLLEPSVGQDTELHAMLRFFLEAQSDHSDDLHAQVKRKIQMLLPLHRATLELVAESLKLHPRTLQRHLAQDGVEFEAFLDGIRRNQAEHMLRKTSLNINQISSELGYKRPTSFCRAHQRWFDMTPLEHRIAFGEPFITQINVD
ncbi:MULTISPECIES: AraC family transcriptional regulator [Pseudomonas]|uniref:AraC family transcriptional regulator n=1 Tax=Pseudomonas vlassakiae TaxID=485888 RepID=A0A923K653_9PSED|nr:MULTISPECIES: AraC family transcriptional regulator [Pseudomonas]MBH3409322.1 AraC family transcriptional regulator ligand-binding domain-containing protein [Pseudomonas putida]MBV4541708.1 AraC family transcriptional regulator [Pseudomonas vlassakiae]